MQNLNPYPPRSACERDSQIIWIYRNFWDALIIATRGAQILLQVQMVLIHWFSSVQLLSRVWLFETPWTAARQASLSITNSRSLLKLMSIELVMPFNHLILCHPVFLPPSIFPSISVFSNESVFCIRQPKYWSCSFSVSPSNEYSGLISFRMDWLDLLAVQGTLKSLLQHHSSLVALDKFLTVLWPQSPSLSSGPKITFPQFLKNVLTPVKSWTWTCL